MITNTFQYLLSTLNSHEHEIAIRDKRGALTYGELNTLCKTLCESIRHITTKENTPIAVLLPKCKEAVALFLAITGSGNFYVPIDPKTPPERLRVILDNLQPELVVANLTTIPTLQATSWSSSKSTTLEILLQPTRTTETTKSEAWKNRIDTDPIYVIYTSGSTGTPKGVTITHRGVIDYIEWARSIYGITERDSFGSQAPFFFDNSTLDIYLSLATGATLNLIPDELFSFPIKLAEYLRNQNITTIFWVPSLMTNFVAFDIFRIISLPNLKNILFAGEAMPARTLNYWRRHLPNSLFSNLYGPTEITVDCTYYIFDRPIADDEIVPIGYPCRNTDILLLTDKNQLAEIGEVGEICVRGSSLALGYWNATEKTNEAFVQNPLQSNFPEKIYRTGDLGQVNPYGELIFLGRKDSQIKHLGYRIELGEIEAVTGGISEVKAACVLYDAIKQEIVMFYQASKEIEPRLFREYFSKKLPRYMIPTQFRFLPEMPLNANGKIDRKELSRTM